MRGFVLCFLAIGVTSAASSTSGPVTMDKLNKVIEKLQANTLEKIQESRKLREEVRSQSGDIMQKKTQLQRNILAPHRWEENTTLHSTCYRSDVEQCGSPDPHPNTLIPGRISLFLSEYVPAFVADPIVHFTEQEKQQFVNFLNEWNKGEINVTDKFQLLKSLKENAPTLVPTLLNMYITYSEKLRKVDPAARAYTIEWVNEFIALTKHRYNIPLLMQKAKQFFDGLRNLSFGDAATFAGQFPEIAHLLVTAPSVQKLRNFTDKLPDNREAYKAGSF